MKPPTIKVLVCSANLGNADPTISFNNWIPQDGYYSNNDSTSKKYPIIENIEDFDNEMYNTNDDDNSNNDEIISYEGQEQFDVIAIGLQEATWDPADTSSSSSNSSSNGSSSSSSSSFKLQDEGINNSPNSNRKDSSELDTSTNKSVSIHSAAKKAVKIAKKGITTAAQTTTIITHRDHTNEAKGLMADGTEILHKLFNKRLPSYKRILSYQRGQMRLLIYTTRLQHNNNHIKLKRVKAQNTGLGGLAANKGGIVGEIIVNDTTIISFITCHLEAHEGIDKFKVRCNSFGKILDGTKPYAVPSIYPDVSMSSHYCFLLGDLNFRTRYNGHIEVEKQGDDVKRLVLEKKWKDLNQADELRMALHNHCCLYGFKTLCCNFPPTFKVVRKQQGYIYHNTRTPSYTDRILWKTNINNTNNIPLEQQQIDNNYDNEQINNNNNNKNTTVKPLFYEPIDDFITSDHKPIRGAFEVTLNIPLSFRRKEVMRTFGLWKLPPIERKHLHLFLLDIQCDIFPGILESDAPSTYVCLVSNPEEILYAPLNRWKQISRSIKKKVRIKHGGSTRHVSVKGWPRTDVIKNTLNPDWRMNNQHIHCILRRHYKDGTPINLSGAMLHIFLFKHNNRQSDEVIGSYVVNLEAIYHSVANSDALSPRESMSQRRASGLGGGGFSSRSGRFASISSRDDMNNNIMQEKLTAEDKIIEIDIDGPLLKNGNQTGVIRCTVNAWWVDETLGGGGRDPDGNSLHLIEEFSSMQDDLCSEDSRHSNHDKDVVPPIVVSPCGSKSKRRGKSKQQQQLPSPLPLLIHASSLNSE